MDIKFKLMLFKERYLNIDLFKKVISHPFLILVLGAIISGLLVPYFTREWQDNQKQLELKTALGDEINKDVTSTTESARLGKSDPTTFENWSISKEMIHSRIQAYFPNNYALLNTWNALSSAVTELIYIVSNPSPADLEIHASPTTQDSINYDICTRLGHVLGLYKIYEPHKPININQSNLTRYQCDKRFIPSIQNEQKLQQHFYVKNDNIDWNALFYKNSDNDTFDHYVRSYFIIANDLENRKNNLLELILNSTITAFK